MIPLILILFFISLLSIKTRRAPWYEQWVWNAISPTVSVFSWVGGEVSGAWHHYVWLVGTVRENERLQKELAGLKQKVVTLEEADAENKRLTELIDLKQRQWPEAIAARVMAYDPRAEFKSLRINRGSEDGVVPDMPVVAPDGLVGRVGPVFAHDAIVLLVIDPASHVDVLVERSRVRGLLAGTAKETELRQGYFLTRMEYIQRASDLKLGDTVVTSGLDQLFPKGILVGTVESIEHSRYGVFVDAEVVPTVDFSRLEEVLVLE